MSETMLTTIDNPFSPFTQFEEWYAFDSRKGYNTLSLLAHLTYSSYDLSQVDQELAIDQAIDEIIFYNVSGVHKKIFREVNDYEDE